VIDICEKCRSPGGEGGKQVLPDEIRIEALVPRPMPDGRRVLVTLHTTGLPPYGLGMASPAPTLTAPKVGDPTRLTPAEGDQPPSPYPDVDLSIYDRHGNEVAATFIVEHKEPDLDFTLHLRSAEPGSTTYTARATLTRGGQVIQVIEAPFEFR
jgi:hypothetical protein